MKRLSSGAAATFVGGSAGVGAQLLGKDQPEALLSRLGHLDSAARAQGAADAGHRRARRASVIATGL